MQLDLEKSSGLVIRSFSTGEIHINDQIVTSHILLTANEIIGEWAPPPIEELSIADFRLLLDHEPEVILFGTGPVQCFPTGALTTDILRQNVGFEVMDTSAACRTFNVLASERRRVVAALLVS
jgi:uncharacterized protein